MNEATAQLNNLRQSPRKVRLVANLIRGKKVADAILTLQFADKRASADISKLIKSALANAKAQSIETDNLVVKKIEVNPGKTLMRRQPAAHGSAHPIRKRTSRVSVVLSAETESRIKNKEPRKNIEKAEKPTKVESKKKSKSTPNS